MLEDFSVPRSRLKSAQSELHADRTQIGTPKTEFCIPTIQPDLAYGLWLMLAALCTKPPVWIVLNPHFHCISAYPGLNSVYHNSNLPLTKLIAVSPLSSDDDEDKDENEDAEDNHNHVDILFVKRCGIRRI